MTMSNELSEEQNRLRHYLSPLHVWALSFGCAVGWGAFVMPGTTFLPKAGPLGTAIGIILGAIVMFIIGVNYHYLMNKFPESGGTLAYTINTLGYDHGFMSAWFLILVYVAIIWANASALGLISKYLFGSTFQYGFHYVILGYDVYFGEVLLSMLAILVCGFLCIKGKSIAASLQVVFALILIGGIVVCAFFVAGRSGGSPFVVPQPVFAPGQGSSIKQIFTIVALSPWAYVGFESISNSAAGFKFSPKKSLGIMTGALLTAAVAYALLAQFAVANIHEEYHGWTEYFGNLGNLSGVEGLPTFHVVMDTMGDGGVFILGMAAFSGIVTGLIGNSIAASRLIYYMAREGMLPEWFGKLNKERNPKNALMFIMGISLFIPLLGRTTIGWIVDVTTIGATIAYAYTSYCAYANAKQDSNTIVSITGMLGVLISGLFFLFFMTWSAEAMSTESYLILAAWSILGFLWFRIVFDRDTEKRFGKSTIVWLTLLFLIFFTSLVWVKRATDDMTVEVVSNIKTYYEQQNADRDIATIERTEQYIQEQLSSVDRTLTRNSVIQMVLNIISLVIMFNIYSIMARREKAASIESTKANERSRAKTVFLSNMSHDIRTPMNAIIGYIHLAEDENVTFEELKDYLQKIKGSSQHLLALINDVLEMSRIESGKMELEPVPMDLVNTFDELYNLFRTQMVDKELDFTVDYSDIQDPYVYCDINRFNRVLLNLVSNAYKFTPQGGSVRVTARQVTAVIEGAAIYEIKVKDTGIGMSPEFAEKVFDAFERERDSTVSGIQGTGLGMSIVKNIVELMGGTITVDSEKGKGTEFTIRVSLKRQSKEDIVKTNQATEAKVKAGEADFSGMRILLVDDMPINRQIAQKLLEKVGFVVDTAENGQEAVDRVKDADCGYYSAILMDIQMPVMNGYEASEAIRALPDEDKKNIPVIAMTANAFAEDVKKAREAGMNAHIAKPIDVKNMIEVLHNILG
jgi:signal transduction histidine kinase/CheY-like chemotaxis protein